MSLTENIIKKIPKENKLRIPLVEDLGKQIPKKYKSKIPFYNNLHFFEYKIKHFLQKNNTIKYYVSDKRYLPYEAEIKKFYNIHKGARCFIIATGPSIRKTNVKLLKNEINFGVNTLYKGLNKFGIKCDYYTVSDYNVWNEHKKELLAIDSILFLGADVSKLYLSERDELKNYQKKEPILIRSLGRILHFGWQNKDISIGTQPTHQIVSSMCLQIAHYMGFKEVYLIGCDCDYSGEHHFDGKKYSYQKEEQPKSQSFWKKYWEETFKEYSILKHGFEKDGRKIYNATVGGKLEVFERVNLEEVIGTK